MKYKLVVDFQDTVAVDYRTHWKTFGLKGTRVLDKPAEAGALRFDIGGVISSLKAGDAVVFVDESDQETEVAYLAESPAHESSILIVTEPLTASHPIGEIVIVPGTHAPDQRLRPLMESDSLQVITELARIGKSQTLKNTLTGEILP